MEWMLWTYKRESYLSFPAFTKNFWPCWNNCIWSARILLLKLCSFWGLPCLPEGRRSYENNNSLQSVPNRVTLTYSRVRDNGDDAAQIVTHFSLTTGSEGDWCTLVPGVNVVFRQLSLFGAPATQYLLPLCTDFALSAILIVLRCN